MTNPTAKAVACRITIWSIEYDITSEYLAAQPNQLTLSRTDICRIGEVPFDRQIERERGSLKLSDNQSCDVVDGDVFYALPRAYMGGK